MSDEKPFEYVPSCSAQGCGQPAVYKVAASWSNGTSQELKCYGLACEAHRDGQLARAQANRKALVLAEGETVGAVGLYHFVAGKLDAELERLPDQG